MRSYYRMGFWREDPMAAADRARIGFPAGQPVVEIRSGVRVSTNEGRVELMVFQVILLSEAH